MANFPGVDYRSGLIGDGYSELDNASHVDKTVLRRRPGYIRKAAVAGVVATPYANNIAVQATDNTLRLVDISTLAVSASKATLGATQGTFTRYNGRLYWSNGSEGPFVLDTPSSTVRSPGITAPAAVIGDGTVTPGGGKITAGVHLFRYRYKNASTGYLSNPSPAIGPTMTALDRITFSIGTTGTDIIRSTEAWADRLVIEATLAAGSAYYAAYEVAMTASSVDFDYSDAQISAQLPAVLFGDDGHNPMPKFDIILEHRNRIFGIQQSTKLLGWSRPGYPESWDITKYSRKLANMETGDLVQAAYSFLGDLYLFNLYGMARFTYPDDPASGTVLSIPSDQGAWNQRCLVGVNNSLYGFGPGGIWVIRAMNPEHISSPVDAFIEETADPAQSAEFFGWYNQEDRSITWAFTATGDTAPKRAVTLSLETGAWSTRTYKHEILGAVYAYQKNYLFANGYMWMERPGYLDGVATVVTATVATGSTDTTINTTETVGDYVGGHLTVGTETRLIGSVTPTSITVTAAFSAVPAVGTVGFVGAAPVTAMTDWVADPDLVSVRNPCALVLEFEPAQSSRVFTVQVYKDFSDTPLTWTRDVSDTPASGIDYLNGGNEIWVQADGGEGKGFVPVPLQTEFSRCLRVRFTAEEPVTPFGLIAIRFANRDTLNKTPGGGE